MNFEGYRRSVYAICLKVLRHAQDAEDATQEALLEAAREARAVRDLEPWLHRVALHTALDVMRRRRTRERHEGRAPAPAARAEDGRIEALYAALADLPEDDRRVLVEHFIHEKTLREMARPEGCSEVAVWKRIGRAKERLRHALALAGAGAALALLPREGFGATAVPAGLIKVAVASAAVLLIGAGAAVRSQPSTSPATTWSAAASRPVLPVEAREAELRAAMKTPNPPGTIGSFAASRPPYPYRFPPPHWSPSLAATWQALRTKRMTIDLQNEPLENLLAEFASLSGVRITPAPGAPDGLISFKVADIVLDGALRLALGPRQLAYEIQDDGSIRVDRADQAGRRIFDEARGIEGVVSALEDVRRRLDAGWNGLDYEDPEAKIEQKLRTARWISPQNSRSLHDYLSTLRDAGGINLILDAGVGQEVWEQLEEPFARPVEDGTLEYHLDRLGAQLGLGFYVTSEQVVLLSTRKSAEAGRQSLALARAARAEARAKLERPISGPIARSMPDLIRALERALDLEVRVSERVWETRTEFPIPAGITAREALRQICVQGGFRWALDGRIYLVDGP